MSQTVVLVLLVACATGLAGCGAGETSCMGDCGATPMRCESAADCDDDNPCTTDTCADRACAHVPTVGASPCSDGDACSIDDHCEEGLCVGSGSCATLACGTDALQEFLTTDVACLPQSVVNAGLSSFLQQFVECDGIAPCTTGCPVLVTSTVTTTYSPAAALGDTARLLAAVEVARFEMRFHAHDFDRNPTDCTFSATAENDPATMSVTHALPTAGSCATPTEDSSATTRWTGADEDIALVATPVVGSGQSQSACDQFAGSINLHQTDFEGIMRAWATWATPECRSCGACDGGPSCAMRAR